MSQRFLFALLFVLVAGCSNGSPGGTVGTVTPSAAASGSSTSSPSATSTPTKPAASAPDDLVVGGERPVTAFVPASYTPDKAAPLLILLHGYGSSGREHESYFRLAAAAEARGLVYAHPDGTRDSGGNPFWNGTDACCDFDRTGVADADYLAAVVADIKAAVTIDPKQIYVIGHSNGGFMSYRMACDHAELVAGIVSLAGATFAKRADCQPSEPVAILEIHGTLDDAIAYDGGTISGIGAPGGPLDPYPGALDTVDSWAEYDGCAAGLSDQPGQVDIDAEIDGADGPAESTIKAATGCQPGGHVELWRIPKGGHIPEFPASFADDVLDFLLAHPKP